MEDRTIFHIDINHCYAQIEEMKYPQLREVPMAVGGHEEKRHGIILAKNDLAKKAGVLTGESLREARDACPDLLIIPPAYDDYVYYTEQVKDICREYSSHIEPFGLDESWVDYTGCGRLCGNPLDTAKKIQDRIREEVGLTVSIGVSWNKVFAKFGSDLIKPLGLVSITRENYRDIVWPAPVADLLYVGRATERKLHERGIRTIGELAGYPVRHLKKAMGVAGEVIWEFANGNDQSPVAESFLEVPVKSVGNSMTAIHDIHDFGELKLIYQVLCESVASRLRDHGMEGDVISIALRSSGLEWIGRQRKIPQRTSTSAEILRTVMELARECYDFSAPVRAAGVSVSGLQHYTGIRQMDLFAAEDRIENERKTDLAMDEIRRRFGFYAVRRCSTLMDRPLTEFNPKEDHTIHPVGYFQGRRMNGAL
jgi:DNA polymerase-4